MDHICQNSGLLRLLIPVLIAQISGGGQKYLIRGERGTLSRMVDWGASDYFYAGFAA